MPISRVGLRAIMLSASMLQAISVSAVSAQEVAPVLSNNASGAATNSVIPFEVPHALPGAATVIHGEITFDHPDATTLRVSQQSSQAIVNWQTFDIAAGNTVEVRQPDTAASALFRVNGAADSRIAGALTANGKLFLINPNGIAFGAGARINAGTFVASTLDIADADFLSGRLTFRRSGATKGIYNAGSIAASGGVGLLGGSVLNEGIVSARLGRVGFGAGDAITLDFNGDNFLSVAVPVSDADKVVDVFGRPLTALVSAGGTIEAAGGRIYISARAARDLMLGAVRIDGSLIANTILDGSDGNVSLGSTEIDAGDGLIQIQGTIDTHGGNGLSGGNISIRGGAVALGGSIDASGDRAGGTINVRASSMLSLAGTVNADGIRGTGGAIYYEANGSITENSSGLTTALGGINGGTIRVVAKTDLTSSGTYRADGYLGLGGQIDLTGKSVRLLSTQISAEGLQQGGVVRIGGAFQGGATDRTARSDFQHFEGRFEPQLSQLPELANAKSTLINDGVVIDVTSGRGVGGSLVVWSDRQTTMLGTALAGGIRNGGAIEVSGKEELRYVDLSRVNAGPGGHLLLDPSFITIGDVQQASSWQYAALLSRNLNADAYAIDLGKGLEEIDLFGTSVALNDDGTVLAVGARGDRDQSPGYFVGSVRLFTFTGPGFNGGVLNGTIGRGYTGAGNVDLNTLEADDYFGASVALNGDGSLLAVGASGDAGQGNTTYFSGSVRLFTRSDTDIQLVGTIGRGYTGNGDLDLGASLQGSDMFGSSVALNSAGSLLAVGATGDRVSNEQGSGSVRLFTFAGRNFTEGQLIGAIGAGYTGPGNLDLTSQLEGGDGFGASVALSDDGSLLAVGVPNDRGFDPYPQLDLQQMGAVRLFNISNNTPTELATIGYEYTGPNDINLKGNINRFDKFGASVALNGAANLLAVGAPGDSGFADTATIYSAGSVRLFSFSGAGFTGGTLTGTAGAGYTGQGDLDFREFKQYSSFGTSVALNLSGSLLAIGEPGNSGYGGFAGSSGVVRLFNLDGTDFANATLTGTIGRGASGAGNLNLGATLDVGADLDGDDYLGSSVALSADGSLLAIGARGDSGFGNTAYQSGAVRLISFSGPNYGGGALRGVIGKGYIGSGNYDLGSNISWYSNFGASVALTHDGTQLAVGQPNDAGYGNIGDPESGTGAVRLFTLSEAAITLKGSIGVGYKGDGDVDLYGILDSGGLFGEALALNGDGTILAVGAPGYSISESSRYFGGYDYGSVQLFSFTDRNFTGGSLTGSIGSAQNQPVSFDLGTNLDQGEAFGASISLNFDGTLLAVGAPRDGGLNNLNPESGSVRLFTLLDGNIYLKGVIGRGYSQLNDIDISASLERYDYFGASLALNGAGDQLAVGAMYDQGYNNIGSGNYATYGSIRFFTFDDKTFGNGQHSGTIGTGYAGEGDFDTSSGVPIKLGSSLAFRADGQSLVAGSPTYNAVLAFGRFGTASDLKFADSATDSVTVSVSALAAALSSGQSISLEASNDITVQRDLIVNNPSGNGGNLSLRAGRSILLDGSIVTDNGNLTLTANSGGNDLVTVNANRLSGVAEITMASGKTIDAGKGAVSIMLDDGTGLTSATSGSISLGSISAKTISVRNAGSTAGSNISLQTGTVLTASGTGRAIDIRAETGSFLNNAGLNAFNLTGEGTFGVFSDDPANTTEGITDYLKRYNVADGAAFSALSSESNMFAYRIAPVLSVKADAQSRIYGETNPTFTYKLAGFVDGDNAAGSVTGAPTLTSLASAAGSAGIYTISVGQGTLASEQGYQFEFVNGKLTVDARPLTVAADAQRRVYGAANPTLTYTLGGQGLVNGDSLSGSLSTSAGLISSVGAYGITQGTLVASSNYDLTYIGANLTIDPRPLTVTADAQRRAYGAANPTLTYTLGDQGLVNGDSLSGSLSTSADLICPVGTYGITQGTLVASSNYDLTYIGEQLEITDAPSPALITGVTSGSTINVSAQATSPIAGEGGTPSSNAAGEISSSSGDSSCAAAMNDVCASTGAEQ